MAKNRKFSRGGQRKNPLQKIESKKQGTQSAKQETNWADVAIRLIDALYDLAQTGNLIGLVLFGIICWIFLISYRLPEDSLPGLLSGIGSFIASESFYILPLSSVLVISVIANFVQAKVYKSHIQDLTDHRKLLVHGLKNGKLKHLEKHHTSNFNIEDTSEKNGDGDENARS